MMAQRTYVFPYFTDRDGTRKCIIRMGSPIDQIEVLAFEEFCAHNPKVRQDVRQGINDERKLLDVHPWFYKVTNARATSPVFTSFPRSSEDAFQAHVTNLCRRLFADQSIGFDDLTEVVFSTSGFTNTSIFVFDIDGRLPHLGVAVDLDSFEDTYCDKTLTDTDKNMRIVKNAAEQICGFVGAPKMVQSVKKQLWKIYRDCGSVADQSDIRDMISFLRQAD